MDTSATRAIPLRPRRKSQGWKYNYRITKVTSSNESSGQIYDFPLGYNSVSRDCRQENQTNQTIPHE